MELNAIRIRFDGKYKVYFLANLAVTNGAKNIAKQQKFDKTLL